jgi:hypothetical protein
MEASDMLDTIHYFLDEDTRYSSIEELKMHDSFRKNIFEKLYESTYRYGLPDDSDSYTASSGIKPYIPPTEIDPEAADPFGNLLDSPLA